MKTKKRMKALGVILSFTLVLAFSPLSAAQREEYVEKFEKTVSLARDGKVIVGNVSGSIEIKTWNREEVQVAASKVSRAATQNRAKENADLVMINVTQENTTVRIETEYPKGDKRNMNVSVTYKLMIPSEADVSATTTSGDVTCEDIGGSLRAKTTSGDVIASGTKDGADCSSTSGDVEALNVTGDVNLHTVSGNIKADSVRGSVEADVVSGDIVLTDITGAERIEGNTMSGNVVYEGDVAAGGFYSLSSFDGRVEFRIPAGSAFDLEAEIFSGAIESDFDIAVRGKIDKKSLSGSVNGGGAEVELKTFSGDIRLKKK